MALPPLSSSSPLPGPTPARPPAALPPAGLVLPGSGLAGDALSLQQPGRAPRTPLELRAAANQLFFLPVQDRGRQIHLEADARDVNEVTGPELLARADAQVQANLPLEQTLLRRLGPERAEGFERVAAKTAADPLARLALQVLLAEGKLTGKRNHEGQDLLATLEGLASRPLAPGLDREALISDLVQEIATPGAISQQYHGTCSVTALQIKMATENPAEYVRIVGGLGSPEGHVQLAGGQELARLPGTERPGTITKVQPDGTRATADDIRTQSSRLWQPALLQFGYGPTVKYDDATDRLIRGRAAPGAASITRVMAALAGQAPEVANDWKLAGKIKVDGRDDLIARIRDAASPQHPVPTAVMYGEPQPFGHEVLVHRITDDQVHFTNPWGMEERMSVADFKQRIMGGYAHLGQFD